MKNDNHWHDVMDVSCLESGDVSQAQIGNTTLAIYDAIDGIHVSDARCSHAGANLCDGYFNGKHIECPLHQGLFDIKTGKAIAAPATRPLKMYQSRVKDGMVQVLING